MTMQNEPLYTHSHVDMLLAAATIIENAKLSKDFLQAKRSTWTDTFFNDIATQIDTAISTHLGADSAKELRSQTRKINDILSAALIDLGEIKVQIEVDYDTDKTKKAELLNRLGYKDHYQGARNRDQEAAISLLYRFAANLDPDTRTDFIMKGINDELLDNVISHSIKLKNANVSQEVQKGVSRDISRQASLEFNQIYQKAIGIAKISRKFYQGNTVKMDQFSFSKVVKNLNLQKPASPQAA